MSVYEDFHRKNTLAFISDNPEQLVVNRRTQEKTAAGGMAWVSLGPLPPQTGRIVRSSNQNSRAEIVTPEGKILMVSATLIGPLEFDLQRGDEVIDEDSLLWIAGDVSRTPPWRTSAQLARHG